jgi:hypothetical protein
MIDEEETKVSSSNKGHRFTVIWTDERPKRCNFLPCRPSGWEIRRKAGIILRGRTTSKSEGASTVTTAIASLSEPVYSFPRIFQNKIRVRDFAVRVAFRGRARLTPREAQAQLETKLPRRYFVPSSAFSSTGARRKPEKRMVPLGAQQERKVRYPESET